MVDAKEFYTKFASRWDTLEPSFEGFSSEIHDGNGDPDGGSK